MSDSVSLGEAPSSVVAQSESSLPATSSSPKVKRELDDSEEPSSGQPNKRQKTAFANAQNGPSGNKGSQKHGPLGQLERSLNWVEENDDLTDEVKAKARELLALVCEPHKTAFKGYKIADVSIVKEEPPSSLPSQDTPVKSEDTTSSSTSNPHTAVPPPFALPNKANFTRGPVPALTELNKTAPPLSTFPPVPGARNYNTTELVAPPTGRVLPQLPPITNVALSMAPFMHTSLLPAYVAPTGTNSYEPLEFLGDAYLEVIATRLIHSRFPLHTVGQKAKLRELLVKNETLAEYSNAYGFGERLQTGHKERHGPTWTKILGDVFEAYLACIIIQDEDSDAGFLAAEQWLTELWAPKILEWRRNGDGTQDTSKTGDQPLDPKTDLNRLLTGKDAKVEYREEKEMQLIKEGNRTVFFMGVYLTGWGFTNQHLGSGEGRSKQIASGNAAEWALRNSQDIIQTANQRKVFFERQFKKGNRGGRGGGGPGGRGGGGRGGFQGPPRGGPGYQHQHQHPGSQGMQVQAGYPQPPPQHQLPPQPMGMGYSHQPPPGSWKGPGYS